jgi:hypothetical protein
VKIVKENKWLIFCLPISLYKKGRCFYNSGDVRCWTRGQDPGTLGFGLLEKELALDIAKKVQGFLVKVI